MLKRARALNDHMSMMTRNVTLTRVSTGQDAPAEPTLEAVLGDDVARLNVLGEVGGDARAVGAERALVQRLPRFVHNAAHVLAHKVPQL
jgi:hypothetical protein